MAQCSDTVWLSGSTHNNITANTLTDNSDDGIDIRQSSDYNSIVGNTIVSNHYDGIELWESSYNDIIENSIIENHYDGIVFYRLQTTTLSVTIL
jgi:parallel beta-helix repeat protein